MEKKRHIFGAERFKLIRTDKTLDLSWKAKKQLVQNNLKIEMHAKSRNAQDNVLAFSEKKKICVTYLQIFCLEELQKISGRCHVHIYAFCTFKCCKIYILYVYIYVLNTSTLAKLPGTRYTRPSLWTVWVPTCLLDSTLAIAIKN